MHMPLQLFFLAFGRLPGGRGPLTMDLAVGLFCAGPIYDTLTRGSVQTTYKWSVPLLILTMPPFSVIGTHVSGDVHSMMGWPLATPRLNI